jgi:hypothetical protein
VPQRDHLPVEPLRPATKRLKEMLKEFEDMLD